MAQPMVSGKVMVIAGVAAVLALGVGAFLLTGNRPGPAGAPGGGADTRPAEKAQAAGFRERGREAGITWRMRFLAAEQGENFKFNLYDHGCGLAVGDFDGDGRDDVYLCNQLGPNALYRNNGDGTFTDVADKAGVALGDRVCVAATWADYLNEGRQSLYVTSTRGGNALFRNMGDGTFKDVTKEAGLTCVAHSQTAVFFDYDNDGYLDLFVTNTADWTSNDYDKGSHYFRGPDDIWKLAESPKEHNILYHNNRDGTFTDVTDRAGVAGKGWGGDVAVFDYNGDGYLDLFVTNMFGASQLYRNNRDGTFTEVTKDVLGPTSWGAIGSKAFDFNNDGRLDLLVVDMHSDMWMPPEDDPRTTSDNLRKKYPNVTGPTYPRLQEAQETEEHYADAFKIRYADVLFGNTLFKSLPAGKFEEVSDRANMETWWPWGIATGDFDNDGYEDVFLPSGMGYPYKYWPNALMMNNGDGTFRDRAAELGIEPPPGGIFLEEKIGRWQGPRSSRCAATADFDGDGRVDLVVNNFNDRPFYFHNDFPRKNYVAFRLTGTKGNRDAIGALVWVHTGGAVMVRQVNPAGGYLSQSSRTLHFGLGDRTAIDWVDVRWPGGARQRIDHPAINTLHALTEPKE